jgi:competence CoiA-like predicted nuclease
MSAAFRQGTSIALVTLSKRRVILVKQVDDVFSGSMPGITTAENAGQRIQQQAVSTIEQVRHLQARLWVYGNLLMLQSLLSDPVSLEKSKEVLHDFFKVWILRLECFIIRAQRSVLNVCRESFRGNLKCGAMAGQDVVVVEAEHLLDTIQAMMDVLRSVAVDANQTLRLITESDGQLH